ncbi:RNA polymerase sigma factor [Cohnella yongneupensis]|uniref:RNA polymerase sigma factor n=1 Tax=Cohnella yongneupensis TaxID=425006 RepID=A0ABW0R3K0_9BACL
MKTGSGRRKMKTADLVRQIKAGDPESTAFTELMNLYYNSLFSLAHRMLKNRQECEDMIQETFIRVLLHIDKYDPSKKFTTWIHQITKNLCLDLMRRKKARPQQLTTDAEYPHPQAAIRSPEEECLEREQADEFRELLSGLRAKDREILYNRYMDDLSLTEISQLTKLPEGTIKSRLSRARQQLKKKWVIALLTAPGMLLV